jgi:calcium-dependent protein kinase
VERSQGAAYVSYSHNFRHSTQRDHILVERVGTLYSMSPETMQGAYDEKADLWSIGVCTYMLLAGGNKPCEGKTPKEMVAKVLAGLYDFEGDMWKEMSESSQTFIRDLLVVETKDRPSASEACKHSWIQEYSNARDAMEDIDIDEAFKDRVRECIIQYADTGPFRKLALNVIAKRSTPKEIFKLRKVFYSFDTLNTGTITLEELREALAQFNVAEDEVEKVFRQIDVNRNNVINYTEFLAACLESQGDLEEHRLAEAFDLMDSDDSGFITRSNLRQILGEHSNEAYIDKLLAEADCENNGKISYSKFLLCFSRESKRRVSKIYKRQSLSDNSNDASSESNSFTTLFENIGLGIGTL